MTCAAWATVIGQFLSALFGAYLIFKGYTKVEMKRETFSFDFEFSGKIISCGFAFWIAQMAMGLISLIYNSQLGKYGSDTAISVYAAVASIMTFVIMPFHVRLVLRKRCWSLELRDCEPIFVSHRSWDLSCLQRHSFSRLPSLPFHRDYLPQADSVLNPVYLYLPQALGD